MIRETYTTTVHIRRVSFSVHQTVHISATVRWYPWVFTFCLHISIQVYLLSDDCYLTLFMLEGPCSLKYQAIG